MQSPIATTKAPGSVKNTSAGKVRKIDGPRIVLNASKSQPKSLTTIAKGR